MLCLKNTFLLIESISSWLSILGFFLTDKIVDDDDDDDGSRQSKWVM